MASLRIPEDGISVASTWMTAVVGVMPDVEAGRCFGRRTPRSASICRDVAVRVWWEGIVFGWEGTSAVQSLIFQADQSPVRSPEGDEKSILKTPRQNEWTAVKS